MKIIVIILAVACLWLATEVKKWKLSYHNARGELAWYVRESKEQDDRMDALVKSRLVSVTLSNWVLVTTAESLIGAYGSNFNFAPFTQSEKAAEQ